MHIATSTLLEAGGGLATTRQLLTVMTRQQLDVLVKRGRLVRVWRGVYAVEQPDLLSRLRALDMLMTGEAVACLGTAAALYGFDVQNTTAVHVLDPGVRMRPTVGLMVHQRTGAPLQRVSGRLATSPAWTAIEVARQLSRPRALATLDAALRSGLCSARDLRLMVRAQSGRRGIVDVRALVELAGGRAESAMESEARLVMIDAKLPTPELQYEIRSRHGDVYRMEFAWPEAKVCAEYESIDWHVGRDEMLRDKTRLAAIQELDWLVIPIVAADVRIRPSRLTDRIAHHLSEAPSSRKLA